MRLKLIPKRSLEYEKNLLTTELIGDKFAIENFLISVLGISMKLTMEFLNCEDGLPARIGDGINSKYIVVLLER